MEAELFERVLTDSAVDLATAAQMGQGFRTSKDFEEAALASLKATSMKHGMAAQPTFHPHAFPDIVVNGFGVEVKHTRKDTWLAVGNSIFEGMRDDSARQVYVLFGKMGGWPEVSWARYEACVTHVRVSHSPRFCIEMKSKSSLFGQIEISYEDFRRLSPAEKMQHIRQYSRGRLRPGERLWWIEAHDDQHALPLEVRLYPQLTPDQKMSLRAEAALLCPQVCAPSRQKARSRAYSDAALYLLTYHGVLCYQARDLFSAGSALPPDDSLPGGDHVPRALRGIEAEMREAAKRLDDALFVEYWGERCSPVDRIRRWLELADAHATNWKPSDYLFLHDTDG